MIREDLFTAWMAMETPALEALAAEVPVLEGVEWSATTLPLLESIALQRFPSADIAPEGDDAALWGRLLRAVGRVYTTTLGASWVCVPMLRPTGGTRLVPVLDVPGCPVWVEVGELLDRSLWERTGTVLADAYELAAP